MSRSDLLSVALCAVELGLWAGQATYAALTRWFESL